MATKAATAQPIGGVSLPIPEALPADGYSRWNNLRELVPFSRETLRKREKEGRFPRRVQLGSARCVAWSNREIHRWIADPVGYRVEG
jgi:prophage regulatory protein